MIEVSTWSELLAAIGQDAEPVKLLNDIVADSTQRNVLNWKCHNFDGDNHKIIGLQTQNALSSGSHVIDNVNFVNCINHDGVFFSSTNYEDVTFTNCRFNGIIHNTFYKNNSYSSYEITFRKCAFALRGYDAQPAIGTVQNIYYENCLFMLYGTWVSFYLSNFNNSMILGGTIKSFGSTPAYNKPYLSVIDCYCLADLSANTVSNCLYNSDKAEITTTGFTAVEGKYFSETQTTSEEKVAYFNSIGFEVIPYVDNSQ